MVANLLTKGNDAYEAKKYDLASNNFERAYRVSTKDTTYLYYAAATAISLQDYDRALTLYKELRDLGYTGIEDQFYATNAETNQEEFFQNKSMRDVSIKAKTHVKPVDKKSESKSRNCKKHCSYIC